MLCSRSLREAANGHEWPQDAWTRPTQTEGWGAQHTVLRKNPGGGAPRSGWDTGVGGTCCPHHCGDAGKRLPALLTSSTVPAIRMNSFVMISTISRTWRESTDTKRNVSPAACASSSRSETPCPQRAASCPEPWPAALPHLSGVSTGVNAQEARVLVAVVVGGCVVHPVVPVGNTEKGTPGRWRHSPKASSAGPGDPGDSQVRSIQPTC